MQTKNVFGENHSFLAKSNYLTLGLSCSMLDAAVFHVVNYEYTLEQLIRLKSIAFNTRKYLPLNQNKIGVVCTPGSFL